MPRDAKNLAISNALACSVADPDPRSGAFLTPGSGIRDGYLKNQDPGSGSGMKNPDHISECLETTGMYWVKILKFFEADPGFGMGKIRIRDPE
jgi:hypothetical protein